jgi:hypothetical protein
VILLVGACHGAHLRPLRVGGVIGFRGFPPIRDGRGIE